MRYQVGFINPGQFYGQFHHEYDFPPVVSLIEVSGREFQATEIIHRHHTFEIYLDMSNPHNGLWVWV